MARIDGRLLLSSSRDGVTWSEPTSIGDAPTSISDLEAVLFKGKFFVFYDPAVLNCITGDGRHWASSTPVASYCSSQGWAQMSSVSAAVSQGIDRVVWIDTRFTRSDDGDNFLSRNPWSGDPTWSNNDVLSLPLRSLGGGSSEKALPVRLTPDLAYARSVRAKATPQGLYVMWIGRAKVGKALDSFHEPPMLFLVVLT